MPRHAFLILAHHKPEQLARLTATLAHLHFDVFVHLDQKADRMAFNGLPNVESLISTRDVQWAGFERVGATLDLLRLARQQHDYQTYTLLSGTCYPTIPAGQLLGALSLFQASRIDVWQDEDPTLHERYARPFFHDSPLRRVLNGFSRRFGEMAPPRVPEGVEVHFGSQWWTLHRSGVDAALDFLESRPDFVPFARRVHIPGEMFFQTVLVATGAPRVPGNRRFADRPDEPDARPRVLTAEDIPRILDSRALFAHTFDEDQHPGVLDALEAAWPASSASTNT